MISNREMLSALQGEVSAIKTGVAGCWFCFSDSGCRTIEVRSRSEDHGKRKRESPVEWVSAAKAAISAWPKDTPGQVGVEVWLRDGTAVAVTTHRFRRVVLFDQGE